MKRLVRVDDRQIVILPHKHNINGLSNEISMANTYVMVPYYEELTWRERRRRKKNENNRSKNGGNLTLKL